MATNKNDWDADDELLMAAGDKDDDLEADDVDEDEDLEEEDEDEDLEEEDEDEDLEEEEEDLEDEDEDLEEEDEDDEYEDDEYEDDEYEDDEYEDDEYEDDEYEDDEYEDDEYEDDEIAAVGAAAADDPMWWTPHVVLGLLLLVGLLGFFGFFNEWLGFLAATPSHDDAEPAASASASAGAVTPPPAQTVRVNKRPNVKKPDKKAEVQRYRAKQILVQYKGAEKATDTVTRTKEEAKARAKEAYMKARKTQKSKSRLNDWVALVKDYSDIPGAAKRGGDLGVVSKGIPHQRIIKVLEKMKVGDIVGPVETPLGFHIVWRTM
jgi:parvulin-like peptidyl-prolyl isomerase